ncbi:MAG: dipeptide ABC transporter ATP-binding protein DppD, partial [Actinobacteria bacterium 21-73-9]
MSLLEITDLSVEYRVGESVVRAVDAVSLALAPGGALGIVGESGCGKTSLGLAIPALLPANARVATGSVTLEG